MVHDEDVDFARELLRDVQFKVQTAAGTSSARRQDKGAPQGDSASPKLFSMEEEPMLRAMEAAAAKDKASRNPIGMGYTVGDHLKRAGVRG